jgi:AcrR family transcriptional regulator
MTADTTLTEASREASTSRRERILDAAARAFSIHGYRGSSLRDIAKDAGCSLTLLDHHFGGKSALLDAVLSHQHERCHERMAGLRSALESSSGFSLDDFVGRWVNFEFDLYMTAEGRQYLELMLRLSTDAEVESLRRRDLDCSQSLVVKAFARARPGLDERVFKAGWSLASAALYASIVHEGATAAAEPAGSDAASRGRRRVITFLVEGLKGCWSDLEAGESTGQA